MRLIHAASLELKEFMPPNFPAYAILSHTWGDGEVTFQDMSTKERFSKKGYRKIVQACRLAIEEGLEYTWVDTCCIDKTSSAELSESINSMYRWYKESEVCHAYLVDLAPDAAVETGLPRCRWFTRGWTLQELIAPRNVKFYNADWTYRGTRETFARLISGISQVPVKVLLRVETPKFSSNAERMSWAARRETTRPEDMAYCLLGIFDLNMPLLYGEGGKAFRRLQEEIMKQTNDLTILAWEPAEFNRPMLGIFAPHPKAFFNSKGIVPFRDDFPSFTITNKGLVINGDIPLREVVVDSSGRKERLYLLQVGYVRPHRCDEDEEQYNLEGGVLLAKIAPRFFYRPGTLPLAGFSKNRFHQKAIFDVSNTILDTGLALAQDRVAAIFSFQRHALYVPEQDIFSLTDARPGTLWNCANRFFLRPKPYKGLNYPMVIAMKFIGMLSEGTGPSDQAEFVKLVVLCDYRRQEPEFFIFPWRENPKVAAFIFQSQLKEDTLSWEELEILRPEISDLSSSTRISVGGQDYRIAASSNADITNDGVPVTALVLRTTRTKTEIAQSPGDSQLAFEDLSTSRVPA